MSSVNIESSSFPSNANGRSVRGQVASALSRPDAPRVLGPLALQQWSQGLGIMMTNLTAIKVLSALSDYGVVSLVRKGIYLNNNASPRPSLDEVAPFVCHGAVVSLQTVLGRLGFLNNPTPWVTCVVPLLPGQSARGRVAVGKETFTFSGMRVDLIDVGPGSLEPYAKTPTATPEKALLDWLYLSHNSPRWPLPPRHDLDLEGLFDMDRLLLLASKMSLSASITAFLNTEGPTPPKPGRLIRARR